MARAGARYSQALISPHVLVFCPRFKPVSFLFPSSPITLCFTFLREKVYFLYRQIYNITYPVIMVPAYTGCQPVAPGLHLQVNFLSKGLDSNHPPPKITVFPAGHHINILRPDTCLQVCLFLKIGRAHV